MNRTVHGTDRHDTAYHKDPGCKMLRSGQDFWDYDCWEEYCNHKHPRPQAVREMTLAYALGKGKWPCSYCYPGSAAALTISPCEDDFGHEPYEYDGAVMCRRCFIQHKSYREAVYWPCTSAIVLGLVPRTLPED